MSGMIFQYFFIAIAVLIIFSNSVKNQKIKSFSSVLMVFLFGILFLVTTFENQVTEPAGLWWSVIVSFFFVGFGIFALRFPEKVLENNAKHFDKFLSKMGGADEFRQPYMKPFLISMAVSFIVIGIVQLFLYIPALLGS